MKTCEEPARKSIITNDVTLKKNQQIKLVRRCQNKVNS